MIHVLEAVARRGTCKGQSVSVEPSLAADQLAACSSLHALLCLYRPLRGGVWEGGTAFGIVSYMFFMCVPKILLLQKESGEEVEVEEFYVKYKNFSYLHCQWASVEDLEKDKRIQQKVKRFKAKQGQNKFLSEIEDELFNPDYVEVDRIMDFARSTDDRGEPVTHYLVKWCSLPYEDSTWELRQDIDQAKIEEFEKLMSREPETERVVRVG